MVFVDVIGVSMLVCTKLTRLPYIWLIQSVMHICQQNAFLDENTILHFNFTFHTFVKGDSFTSAQIVLL